MVLNILHAKFGLCVHVWFSRETEHSVQRHKWVYIPKVKTPLFRGEAELHPLF